MNKKELAIAISEKTTGSVKASAAMLEAFMEVVADTLQKGDDIKLVGFGSFTIRQRAARKAKNPRTGEEIIIPAMKAPVFKAGNTLKKKVE